MSLYIHQANYRHRDPGFSKDPTPKYPKEVYSIKLLVKIIPGSGDIYPSRSARRQEHHPIFDLSQPKDSEETYDTYYSHHQRKDFHS